MAASSYAITSVTLSGDRHASSVENSVNVSNSPRSSSSGKGGASSWMQIVRGESDTSIVSQSLVSTSSSLLEGDCGELRNGGSSNAGKCPAWNTQSPSGPNVEIGPVMGSATWPALSESARGYMKSSSDSVKGLTNGSSSSMSTAQGGGVPLSFSQKQVGIGITNSTTNHTVAARHRAVKRNGSHALSNGVMSQPSGSLVSAGEEVHLNNTSPRDHTPRNPQTRNVSDPPSQQRNSFRSRNVNLQSRGDFAQHQNYGGRRDQDRPSQDVNVYRNFNGRDTNLHPQIVSPRFVSPMPPPHPLPPASAPLFVSPPFRPFGSPMAPQELAYQFYYFPGPPMEPFRGMHFPGAPILPHTVFFPAPDLQLPTKILNQINYYFSDENLVRDIFLRQHMDEQGWVPINLIAGFNRVAQLTDNIPLILDSIRNSSVVEVQGDIVRRRNDWGRWIMPQTFRAQNVADPRAMPGSSSATDLLAMRVHAISLDGSFGGGSHARSQADNSLDVLPRGGDSGVDMPIPSSTPPPSLPRGAFDRSISAN